MGGARLRGKGVRHENEHEALVGILRGEPGGRPRGPGRGGPGLRHTPGPMAAGPGNGKGGQALGGQTVYPSLSARSPGIDYLNLRSQITILQLGLGFF